jgi:hypothetical protein
MENENTKELEIDNNSDGTILIPQEAKVKKRFIWRLLKFIAIVIVSIVSVPLFVLFFLYVVPGIQELGKGRVRIEVNDSVFKKEPVYKKQIGQIDKDLIKVSQKLNSFTPIQPYIVISTTNNRFVKGFVVLVVIPCS